VSFDWCPKFHDCFKGSVWSQTACSCVACTGSDCNDIAAPSAEEEVPEDCGAGYIWDEQRGYCAEQDFAQPVCEAGKAWSE